MLQTNNIKTNGWHKSLTGKMLLLLGKCVITAILFYILLYMGGKSALKFYFENSNYYMRVEKQRADELQQYVRDNKISTTDTKKLTAWVQERNIPLVTISRKRKLLYDSTYMARNPIGETDAEYLHRTWQYFYEIEFEDGMADVLIYERLEEKYYFIMLIVSILISVGIMLLLFVRGIQKEVLYIKKLKEEIDLIGGGCLTHEIPVHGDDELSLLAQGMNRMRISFLETQELEEKLRLAEDELVTGMSHDLRTPLTGLMTYLEILRKQEEKGEKPDKKYLEKSFEKAMQMRDLSNQMFEYLLAKQEKEIELCPPSEWNFIMDDYISDFICCTEKMGFRVECHKQTKIHEKNSINDSFIGRIFDNIISNIEKYADKQQPLVITILLENDCICLQIQNTIAQNITANKANGIGMKNVELMMKKMGGFCKVERKKPYYILCLDFPVYKE